jgi:hypothetical protein
MSKIVNQGETRSIVAKAKSFDGALCVLNLTHATANTAFINTDLNLDNLRFSVKLIQGGKSSVICNDRASILCRESAYDNSNFDAITIAANWNIVVPHAAGVKAVAYVPLYVDFGGIININKGDEITFEVSMNNGTFNTTVDANASFGLFSLVEGQGVQFGFDTIETFTVPPGESLFNVDGGDNLQRVTFVNTDQSSNLLSVHVLDSVTISGADWAKSSVYSELLAQRAIDLDGIMSIPNARFQTFRIYDGEDLDAVSINMNLIPANVTAGKNAVVLRRFNTCEKTIHAAIVKESVETQKAVNKVIPSKQNVKSAIDRMKPFTKFSR